MSDFYDDGYRTVPPKKEASERGIKCGVCGMKFDHGKAYGFVCQNQSCPIQPKVTC